MRPYLSMFKLNFINNLQYRAAALAGLSTQIFFGLMFIMVFMAFFQSTDTNLPMNISELVTYIWLQQGFLILIYLTVKDKDIISMIQSGDVALELCRPQNIYFKWYAKIYSSKLASVLLRFPPLILFAFIVPAPFKMALPQSISSFLLFIITLLLASLLVTALVTLFHVLIFYTLEPTGVISMLAVIADIFSGMTVPLPFFPLFLRKIALLLPFHFISDFPFRIYTGNIPLNNIFLTLIQEVIWILIIIALGYFLSKNALKKVVIQGG